MVFGLTLMTGEGKMGRRKAHSKPSRRDAMKWCGAGIAAYWLPGAPVIAAARNDELVALKAAPGIAPIAAPDHSGTRVWAYNGAVPGTPLRVQQGREVRLRFVNALPQPSTVHWHGIRLDNAMDGVAGLTQDAVPPGGTFDYVFTPPDAGTFWYHPHNRSWEQMARGLYGALIVEEAAPPRVDHDVALIFDDWRLGRDGQIDEASLGHMMDWSHAGRLGNWLTVNGRSQPKIAVAKGERLRLRLVNCANARVMSLSFDGHDPRIVALDGQPVAPYAPRNGVIDLAPAQRADVIVDMGRDPGTRSAIREVSTRAPLDAAYLVYDSQRVVRESPLDAAIRLPDNALPKRLDLANALAVDLVMEGGAMGGMRRGMMGGRRMGMREMMGRGMAWTFNGVAGMPDAPLADAKRGRTLVVRMVNDTAWPHAMHLHGHHFRVVARDGHPVANAPWRDTELMQRGERADIAFVADNPGKWLLHCHMLEHQAAGMKTWIRVGA